jgi:Zn finger protein HypA/HybF involved in hydrogenase expression
MSKLADKFFHHGFWRNCSECGKLVRERYETEFKESYCPACGHTFDDVKDEYAVLEAYPAK